LLAAGVDMVLSTYLGSRSSIPNICGQGTVAAAAPHLFERGTGRPVNGIIFICQVFKKLDIDLTTLAHETFHAIVRPCVMDCQKNPKHILD
jgi:hypothetical protein